MNGRIRAAIEVILGVAAAVGCVASWQLAQRTVDNAPIGDGQPRTVSVAFYAPTLGLAFILLTLTGILAVVGIARWRRSAGTGSSSYRDGRVAATVLSDESLKKRSARPG